MASRGRARVEPVGQPQVVTAEGRQLVQQAITKGESLLAQRPIPRDEYAAWQLFTKNCLERTFGTNSTSVNDVMGVSKLEGIFYDRPEQYQENERAEFLRSQLSRLRALGDLLAVQPASPSQVPSSPVAGKKVFIVHGHNEKLLHECARFLERLEQQVVVLREESNRGRTIIEKFEQQSVPQQNLWTVSGRGKSPRV